MNRKGCSVVIVAVLMLVFFSSPMFAQQPQLITQKKAPLSQVISTRLKPMASWPENRKEPSILWGTSVFYDVAQREGFFKAEGVSVEFFREDDYIQQIEMCLRGETASLRMPLEPILAAAPLFAEQGDPLVVVLKESWSGNASAGKSGDMLVGRAGLTWKNVKKVGVQWPGPQLGLICKAIEPHKDLSSVEFVFFSKLSPLDYDPASQGVKDAVSAIEIDKSFDLISCVESDAKALVANKALGLKIWLDTSKMSRQIADVRAFRKSFYTQRRQTAFGITHAFLVAGEHAKDIVDGKRVADYNKMILNASQLVWGSPDGAQQVADFFEGCAIDNYSTNVDFFTNPGNLRGFKTLKAEGERYLRALGLLTGGPVQIEIADWWSDGSMAKGLRYAGNVKLSSLEAAPKLEATARPKAAATEAEAAARFLKTLDMSEQKDIELSMVQSVTFRFERNETSIDLTPAEVEKLRTIATIQQTYPNGRIFIEAHWDPRVLRDNTKKIDDSDFPPGMKQDLKNQLNNDLQKAALPRAVQWKKDYLAWCAQNGIAVNGENLVPVSRGASKPVGKLTGDPVKDAEVAKQSRRVSFMIFSFDITE